MKILSSVILLFLMANSFAGHRGGNGGDAVVCPNSVKILDEVEATKDGFIYRINKSLNYRQQVEQVLNDLSKYIPNISREINEVAEELLGDVDKYLFDRVNFQKQDYVYDNIVFTRDNLVDIDDSAHLTIPVNCRLEQIVNQRKYPKGNQRRFIFNANLFDSLGNKSIAALILHEAIYYFYQNKIGSQDNSQNVRHFNNLISSKYFTENLITQGPEKLLDYLFKLGVKDFYIDQNYFKYDISEYAIPRGLKLKDSYFRFVDSDGVRGNLHFREFRIDENIMGSREVKLKKSFPLSIESVDIKNVDLLCPGSKIKNDLGQLMCFKVSELVKIANISINELFSYNALTGNISINRSLFEISKNELRQLLILMQYFDLRESKCDIWKYYLDGRKHKLEVSNKGSGDKIFSSNVKLHESVDNKKNKMIIKKIMNVCF